MRIRRILGIVLTLAMMLIMLPGMNLTASAEGETNKTTITSPATTGTMTITLKIKASQTIAAADVNVTYGDTDKEVNATTSGDGVISYAVKNGSGDYIEVANNGKLTIKKVPADGKAYVTVTASETQTYASATKDVTVTISKANAVDATVTANDRTYDGTEKSLVNVDNSTLTGGTMNYVLGENATTAPTSGWDPSIPAKTNAGTYYVWHKVVGDNNHNDTTPVCVTTEISRKSLSGATVTLDKSELTYNGSEQSVDVTGVSLDGKSLTAETDYEVSGNTGKDKGDYTVTVTGKGNYKDTATAGWKIVAKAMTVKADPVSKIYDGNEYGITVNVTDPASGTTTKFGTKDGDYKLDASPKFKTAGTHNVYFKVSGNDNYDDYTGSATVTIIKKPVTAIVSAEDKTYDGKLDATVSASVSADELISGDSIEISGLKGSFETKDVGAEKTVNVDSSAKTISGTGADNYEVTIPENAKATISKADATVKVKDQSIKVGDAVPDLSNPVLGKDYTVEGLVGGDALTTVPKLEYASKPDNTKPGTYEITANNASAGDNYDLSYQKGILSVSEKAPSDTTPVGSVHKVSGSNYIVTSAGTVSLLKANSKKSFTLPATVVIDGKSFKVTGINAKAFKGTKVKTLTLKTKNLTKKSVKGSLKGSKVKTVKVKVGNKKTNKKYVKKYRKYFTKKNCGKKVRVRR